MPETTDDFLIQDELFMADMNRRERRRRRRNELEARRRRQVERRRRQREQERQAARAREQQEEQRRRSQDLQSSRVNLDRHHFVFEASVPKVIKAVAPATPVSLLTAGSP